MLNNLSSNIAIALQVTETTSDLLCFEDSDTGSYSVSVQGGNPPYQYQFNNGEYGDSNAISGLDSGTYTWTVRDSRSCWADGSVIIRRPTGKDRIKYLHLLINMCFSCKCNCQYRECNLHGRFLWIFYCYWKWWNWSLLLPRIFLLFLFSFLKH